MRAFDLKVLCPVGSVAGEVAQRGAFVAMGNTSEEAAALVRGRLQRGVESDGTFKRVNGTGYVAPKDGAYKRAQAQACGVDVSEWLVETFGGMSPALYDALREASDWRANKLTSSEYDETTWSARTWMTFVAQRISVAVQLSSAQEVAEALGLSVAADPRAQ